MSLLAVGLILVGCAYWLTLVAAKRAVLSVWRALPLLLACSCGGRTSLLAPADECPLASSTVTVLSGPWLDQFTGLSIDRDGNAILAHGLYRATEREDTTVHQATMFHTLDADGCIRSTLVPEALLGFTAGTAGTWFASTLFDLVELSPAGEHLAEWELLAFTGGGSAAAQTATPVALPGGRAMVCAGVRGEGGYYLDLKTPLTELGAIHVAIFSRDRDEPVTRVFPVTQSDGTDDTDGRRVQCEAAWTADGRVAALAVVEGTLLVGGEEIVVEEAKMLWLELDDELELLSARVLDDVLGGPHVVRAGPDGTVYVGVSDDLGGVVARLGPGGDTIWRARLGSAVPTALAVEASGDVQYLAVGIDKDSQPAEMPVLWGRISAEGEPRPARTVARYEKRTVRVALEIDGSGRPVLAGEIHAGDHLELEDALRETEEEDGIFLARFDEYPTN